jgi:hypothetical protein
MRLSRMLKTSLAIAMISGSAVAVALAAPVGAAPGPLHVHFGRDHNSHTATGTVTIAETSYPPRLSHPPAKLEAMLQEPRVAGCNNPLQAASVACSVGAG